MRHAKGKGCVISIQTMQGATMFACAVGEGSDVSLDSWWHIEAMIKVVRRTGHCESLSGMHGQLNDFNSVQRRSTSSAERKLLESPQSNLASLSLSIVWTEAVSSLCWVCVRTRVRV